MYTHKRWCFRETEGGKLESFSRAKRSKKVIFENSGESDKYWREARKSQHVAMRSL